MIHQAINEIETNDGLMDITEHRQDLNSLESNKRQKTQNSNNTLLNKETPLVDQQINLINNSFTVIELKFINEKDSFNTISFHDVEVVLNKFTTNWEFIAFSNDQKYMTFSVKDKLCLNILINIKQIKIQEKNFDVEIIKVTNLNKNKGIIFKREIRVLPNEEIKECLKDQNVSDIVRITKIDENGSIFDTGSFILIFNGEVPNAVKIYCLTIPVTKLKPRPMKCNHCHLFGHTSKRCSKINKEMCKNCFQEIVLDIYDHICVLKCKNCGQNHKSDDKNCPEYKNEIEILEIKGKFGVTYGEAKVKFLQDQKGKIQHPNNLNDSEEIRKNELQLAHEKNNSILEKYRKIQTAHKAEMKEKYRLEKFVIPELKKNN